MNDTDNLDVSEVDMASRSSARNRTAPRIRLDRIALLALSLALALAALLSATGCSPKPPETTTPEPTVQSEEPTPSAPATPVPAAPAATELKMEDTKVGTGATAKTGDEVTVHYTGYLTDGTKFDSSLDSNQPFTFKVGNGDVIAGWDQGIPGMKVGGKRKLTIPSELGYGPQGAGDVIPPNATLVFDVELLSVN